MKGSACEGCGEMGAKRSVDPLLAAVYDTSGKGWYNPIEVFVCDPCLGERKVLAGAVT